MEAIAYDQAWYERYDLGSDLDETKKYLEYAAALDLVRDVPHCGKSLDIGTATGRYLLALDRLGYLAHGIDVSAEAVEITRNRLQNRGINGSRVLQMDAQNLDFPDGSFKLVSCMMGTLAHIARPARALAEVRRVLMPGGLLLLSNWQPRSTEVDFLTANTDAHNSYLSERSLELEEVIGLVTEAGLVPERRAYAVLLPTGAIMRLIDCCVGEPGGYLERLALLEAQLRPVFPRLRGQILIVLARRPQ